MQAHIIPEIHYKMLPLNIVKKIDEAAKKNWGVKFISRETGEEISFEGLIGLFAPVIQVALKEADI